MSALRYLAVALVAAGLAGCGKGSKDPPKTAEQQRAEREAFEQKREERAMQDPEKVFGRALKTQERAAKKAEAHRQKVVEDAEKQDAENSKSDDKAK